MALLDAEVQRIRYELGYNVLSIGAEPYVGVSQLFEQVISQYLTAGESTTSATAVTSATSPTPVTLTLASVTGVEAGTPLVIDVDARQERAVVQSVSGSTVVVSLSKTHSGTYPVTVEGGEAIVRAILRKLQELGGLGSTGLIDRAGASSGIKKVDEIEFFSGSEGASGSRIEQMKALREYWRDELASALGVERLNGSHGGSSVAVY